MKQISFKLQVFEGPLDLLLHLINKNKVSIYDIPISEITEQYIDYIAEMKHFDIEVSSEFLVLAAHLLYIKSKMLLPKYGDAPEDEDDPRTELTQRLVEYKKFKKAAQFFCEREFAGSRTFYKMREYIEPVLIDESLSNITIGHLVSAIYDISERIKYRRPVNAERFKGIVGREVVSVFSKLKNVLKKLKTLKKINFIDIFRNVKTKTEAVASFLAVLELIKMNAVKVSQNNGETQLKYIKKRKGGSGIFGNTKD